MEPVITEHISNWSYFNILLRDEIPFIFKGDELLHFNNTVSEDGIKFKGVKEGVWIYSYEYSNSLKFYFNGKLNGKGISESSKEIEERLEHFYIKGLLNGKSVFWYKDGQKKEVDYVNGKENGKEIWWYEDGKKCEEIDYVNGKKHGKEIYWYENGQKREEIDYVNGKKHGKNIHWYENGQKKKEINYIDDEKQEE